MRIVGLLVLLALALIPSAVFAQEGAITSEGLLVRIGGTLTLTEGQRVETAIVLGDDAIIDGVIEDTLLVIGGDARIAGSIEGDLVVIGGDILLAPGSLVNGDVNAVGGEIERSADAVVGGEINENNELVWRWWGWLSFVVWAFLWLGFTVAFIISGLLFAAIAGRQLTGSAHLLTSEAGPSILATVVIWLGVPIAVVLLMATVIGIPFGIGVLVMLLPALWWLGYIVTATRLGLAMTQRRTIPADGDHPYLAAVLGILVLQVVGIIPALGFIVVMLAGLFGAGGLVLFAWNAWQGRPPAAKPATGAVGGEQA